MFDLELILFRTFLLRLGHFLLMILRQPEEEEQQQQKSLFRTFEHSSRSKNPTELKQNVLSDMQKLLLNNKI